MPTQASVNYQNKPYDCENSPQLVATCTSGPGANCTQEAAVSCGVNDGFPGRLCRHYVLVVAIECTV